MSAPCHAVTLLARHLHAILRNFDLRRTIVQRDENIIGRENAIQPTWNWLSSPIGIFIVLLTKWSVWIGLSENVAIAVLVKWMLEWISMRWKFHYCVEIRCGSAFLACWSRK